VCAHVRLSIERPNPAIKFSPERPLYARVSHHIFVSRDWYVDSTYRSDSSFQPKTGADKDARPTDLTSLHMVSSDRRRSTTHGAARRTSVNMARTHVDVLMVHRRSG
jgi:hypothetical protein